jgi:hypothetical protein
MAKFYLKISIIYLFFLVVFCSNSKAQSTTIGSAPSRYNPPIIYGPMLSDTVANRYSRYAWIYPNNCLGNLQHGDTIRSVEFLKEGFGGMKGNANFKIYIRNSSIATFPMTNLNWKREADSTGCKLVYNGNPTNIVGNTPGYKLFPFDNDGFYVFDTTGGGIHLEILTEYTNDTGLDAVIEWVFEDKNTAPCFANPNEGKFSFGTGSPPDTTNNISINKPHLRINHYKYRNNIFVRNIYCLGSVPLLMGLPDTISTLVKNVGLDVQRNVKFYLNVTGANSFQDTIILDSIARYQERIIKFPRYRPDSMGTENIWVSAQSDDDNNNNGNNIDRSVNYNVFSHADPFKAMDGGMGFNDTVGDFVARFYIDTSRYINQIKVEFFSSNRSFQLGIWDAKGANNTPGNNLYTSATLTNTAGTYILPVKPIVKVDGSFFVGIRQLSKINVAFGFQYEEPIRPDIFYFTVPPGNTDWTPFSPGYDFKFSIQPRLQVADDIAVLRIDNPPNNASYEYSMKDSLFPKATFINYGYKNQTDSFPVIFEIRDNKNKLVFTSTRWITLNAEDSITVTFDKSFSYNNLGNFKCTARIGLTTDMVLDNNSLSSNFSLIIFNDVAVDNIFNPPNSSTFELLEDSIWPAVRVANYGVNFQFNFDVVLRVLKDTSVLYQRVKKLSLDGGTSVIINFDTFAVEDHGNLVFEAFTRLSRDSFPSNDTTRNYIEVFKSKDAGATAFLRPTDQGIQEISGVFRPFVDFRNQGIKDQDTIPAYCVIRYPGGQEIYRDSALLSIAKLSLVQHLFKNFTAPDTAVILEAMAFTRLKRDQMTENDTIQISFFLIPAYDLGIIEQVAPPVNARLKIPSDTVYPVCRIFNLGFRTLNTRDTFYCTISDIFQELYSDTIMIDLNLKYNEGTFVNAKKGFRTLTKGTYYIHWKHRLKNDAVPENDELYSTFYVARNIDMALTEISIPADNSFVEYSKDTIYPTVKITNESIGEYKDSLTLFVSIEKEGLSIYSEMAKTGNFIGGETKTIIISKPFGHKLQGPAQIVAFLVAPNDVYPENDTFRNNVFFQKSFDAALIKIVFPQDTSKISKGLTYVPEVRVVNSGDKNLQTPFSLGCLIYLNGKLVYIDNKTLTLDSGLTTDIRFDSSLYFTNYGYGEAIFFAALGPDQERSNDTIRSYFKVNFGLGISEVGRPELSVYPNPANDILFIDADKSANGNGFINLIDVYGKTVLACDWPKDKKQAVIELKDIKPGFYVIIIKTTDGLWIQKVVIR